MQADETSTWLPDDFRSIAIRLRNGERALDIRNEIIEAEGLSRLAAGKKVEAVEKVIRAAKTALAGGLASVALLLALLVGTGEFRIVHIVLGLAAFGKLGFALSLFSEYRHGDPDDDSL